MKVLDLFSGIGGFSLGLERAGMETIAFCEIEPFCQRILKKHWPEVPVFSDIKELTADDLPEKPDIICGGYPCQPFSVAGKQRGKEDHRHLWPEMLRIIKECRPTWIIAENVAGHISMGLDDVLFDLEAQGYTTQPFVIPACGVKAHHKRDRVWIIGYTERDGSPSSEVNGRVNKAGNGLKEKPETSLQPPGTGKSDGNESLPRDKAVIKQRNDPDSGNQRLQKRPKKPFLEFQQLQGELVRSGETIGIRIDPTKPAVCGVTDGFPGRVDRIKALGNAVVPQIPEIIGRAIKAASL